MMRVRRLLLVLILILCSTALPVSADELDNLAQGKEVTGSYIGEYDKKIGWIWSNLTDGDREGKPLSVRGEDGTGWVRIDFDVPTEISRVIIIPFDQCYPTDFTIDILQDGEWTTVVTKENQKIPQKAMDAAGTLFRGDVIDFPAVTCSAVRMNVTGMSVDSNGDTYLQLREMEVYNLSPSTTSGDLSNSGSTSRTEETAPHGQSMQSIIIGIAVGAALLMIGIVTLFIWLLRKHR